MLISAALFAVPVVLGIHFIPSIIARKRPDFLVVFLVNLLAGWSVIGWGIALYLALRKIPDEASPQPLGAVSLPVTSVADELAKLRNLRDQGVLTAEQFERQKANLLR